MRTAVIAALLAAVILSLAACGAAVTGTTTTIPMTSTSSPSSTAAATTSPAATVTTSTSAAPTAPAIPSGAIALFGTISSGVKSDSLKLIGGDISWTSTHYEFLRYLPDVPALDEFGWTTSQSYAHSYMWGFTQDGWVYRVRVSTDTGSKEVTRLDPATGNTMGAFPTIYTSDRYAGFTVFGDRLIYRSRIGTNLAGSRTGGGHIMEVRLGGSGETKLLDYDDADNVGNYYAVGAALLTIDRTEVDDRYYYDIYRVDPATLRLGDLLYTYVDADFAVEFYAGETALYWGQADEAAGEIRVIRLTPGEEPSYFVTISENGPSLVSVDESDGVVLLVITDSSPESPFFTTVDLATMDLADLAVEPGFFSTLIYGTGQFLVLE